MKIKLKNSEWVQIHNAITNADFGGKPKFTYALARNKSILKPHIEAIQEAANQWQKSDRSKEFQRRSDALLKEHGTQPDGQPSGREFEGGQLRRVVPASKQGAFVAAQEKLREEFKDVFDAMEINSKELEAVLKDDVTFDVRTVKFEDLPMDIPQQFMNAFFLLVEDEDEKAGKTVH